MGRGEESEQLTRERRREETSTVYVCVSFFLSLSIYLPLSLSFLRDVRKCHSYLPF